MTDSTRRQTRTRPTDEIEPMVPMLPREYRTDGGAPTPRTRSRGLDRPPATDHAELADRHREEIEPMVPQLD